VTRLILVLAQFVLAEEDKEGRVQILTRRRIYPVNKGGKRKKLIISKKKTLLGKREYVNGWEKGLNQGEGVD